MVYSNKEGKFIAIEINDLLGGRKPGLYIGQGYQLIKVACFSTYTKAQLFEELLQEFFGDRLVKDEK